MNVRNGETTGKTVGKWYDALLSSCDANALFSQMFIIDLLLVTERSFIPNHSRFFFLLHKPQS